MSSPVGQPVITMPGGVIFRYFETGGNACAVAALSQQAGFCPRAQREAQRVEQDRFPRTRFAGEDTQAGFESQIETLDENNVADAQCRQHCGVS